jgi:hypothetical protein
MVVSSPRYGFLCSYLPRVQARQTSTDYSGGCGFESHAGWGFFLARRLRAQHTDLHIRVGLVPHVPRLGNGEMIPEDDKNPLRRLILASQRLALCKRRHRCGSCTLRKSKSPLPLLAGSETFRAKETVHANGLLPCSIADTVEEQNINLDN